MKQWISLLCVLALLVPASVWAEDTAQTLEALKKQVQTLNRQIEALSKKVDENAEEVAYTSEVAEIANNHAATDRLNFYGDLRTKVDSVHYRDTVLNNGATPLSVADSDNDILYTTRLRLGMKAHVWRNVDFAGRLSMYKVWGDATGIETFDTFNAVSLDGTSSGNPGGDILRVERAYFTWKDIGRTPFYLSIGRRPSTYGPPTHIRENEMRGGTPSGHLVNYNFDGLTLGYKLEEATGLEGMVARFCYGLGYESDFGRGTLNPGVASIEDTHLGGFNVDVINNDTHFLQATLFRAFDITDGFTGLAVPPMYDSDGDGMPDTPNTNGFISKVGPTTNIGDMWLAGLGYTHTHQSGVQWFLSGAWNHAEPNGNAHPMFGGLLGGAGDTDSKDGYSLYAGVQVPFSFGKVGLEYNYGSKYWFNFTQAQDDIIGSKLAARGHVGEAYVIFDINPKMFIKIAGLYYDYRYSGSGAPVGEPQKISDLQDGTAFSPLAVVDDAYNLAASLTVKF